MADLNIPFVNTSSDTFASFVTKVNNVINAVQTEVMTANGNANGSVTSGNAYVNGIVYAQTLCTDTALRGGNVQTSGVLPITSNVSVGNSTANVQLGFGTVNVGSISVNSTILAAGANVLIGVTGWSVGNSTVNLVANSLQLTAGATTLNSTMVNVATVTSGNHLAGGNVVMSNTGLTVGNSTVNSQLVQAGLTVQNSTQSATVTPGTFVTGSITINSTAVAAGANVLIGLASVGVGNSTVNTSLTAAGLSISGVGVPTLNNRDSVSVNNIAIASRSKINFISGTGVSISGSDDSGDNQVNVTITAVGGLAGAGGANTNILFNDSTVIGGSAGFTFTKTSNNVFVGNQVAVGTNVTIGAVNSTVTDTIVVGNSTVQTWANSSAIVTSNVTTIQFSTNTAVITSNASIGNSTVNTQINSTAINSGSLNLAAGATTANSTLINTAAVQVGTSVNVGNSTVNTAISQAAIALGNSTIQTVINSTSLTTQGLGATQLLGIAQTGVFAVTTTGTGAQVVDSWTLGTWRTAKYLVSIKDNTQNNYMSSEVLLLSDDTNGDYSEYGTMWSNAAAGSLGSFSASQNSTTIQLVFTPTSSNTTVKGMRTLLPV